MFVFGSAKAFSESLNEAREALAESAGDVDLLGRSLRRVLARGGLLCSLPQAVKQSRDNVVRQKSDLLMGWHI